tara:strand:- start:14 stop:193 length:180 start_codon:yes stop_codon:yes gene_type:complete
MDLFVGVLIFFIVSALMSFIVAMFYCYCKINFFPDKKVSIPTKKKKKKKNKPTKKSPHG